MKLLPFTETCRIQLLEQGYTHVVLKRVIEPKDRDYISEKELHIYEAYMPGNPMLEKFISEEIGSEHLKNLLLGQLADYYVVVGNAEG
jgi:hypothetical protein